MVDHLNQIFTHFDTLATKHGCEKIRTVGAAYVVAAGVPGSTLRPCPRRGCPRPGDARVLVRRSAHLPDRNQFGSGPAGVIGTSKFQYDVWGDTVNTASRMESHGEPGRIQISRGQMAAFLARALAPSSETFTDTTGHTFEDDVAALAGADITRDCNPPDNTRFCPDQPVTCGQVAAFLNRALLSD